MPRGGVGAQESAPGPPPGSLERRQGPGRGLDVGTEVGTDVDTDVGVDVEDRAELVEDTGVVGVSALLCVPGVEDAGAVGVTALPGVLDVVGAAVRRGLGAEVVTDPVVTAAVAAMVLVWDAMDGTAVDRLVAPKRPLSLAGITAGAVVSAAARGLWAARTAGRAFAFMDFSGEATTEPGGIVAGGVPGGVV